MQLAKLVGAVALFEKRISLLGVKVRPLEGVPCTKVGDAAVPTRICAGKTSTMKRLLLSTVLGPVFWIVIE